MTRAGAQSPARTGWLIVKWVLTLVVLVWVGRQIWRLWNQPDVQRVEWHVGWLLLSAVAYTAGWLPSVWFWRRLLAALGGRVSFSDAARAYYSGHLGKYVPGKAAAIVIRAALVKDRGARPGAAALAATYEVLLGMAVGGGLAVALSPFLLSPGLLEKLRGVSGVGHVADLLQRLNDRAAYLPAVCLLVGVALALPLISRGLTMLAVRLTPAELRAGGTAARIDSRLLAAGLCAQVGGWMLQGLSLGLALRGVSPDPFDLSAWPVWTGGVGLATSVGFAVLFAPGGIGVREGLLIGVLESQPQIGPQQAVAAALLLRLVWLSTELGVAAVLYCMYKNSRVAAAERTVA